jgi:hypothetical protein
MEIYEATYLWIEAGAMSGPPAHRHQIEFAADLVEFFDDYSRFAGSVPLRLPKLTTYFRPLTHRGRVRHWGDIWRLGLLTPRMGGPPYAGRVIRFRRAVSRHPDGWSIAYELAVANVGSATARRWDQTAQARGEVGTTFGPGGRRYGWY